MSDEPDRLDPEEKALVARLRQVPAITPSPLVRSRIQKAADEASQDGRRSWWRRLPAAAIAAGVVLSLLFPAPRSTVPVRMWFHQTVIDAGYRTYHLTELSRTLDVLEQEWPEARP
jgi:hypothetical protein